MTGTSRPTNRVSARSIVPSPPTTIAMSAVATSPSASAMPCFSSSSSGNRSSTAASRATLSSCASAGPIVARFPCVITAARRTALADLGCDSLVDVIGKSRLGAMDEVEERFAVPLWPWQPGVYDADRGSPPPECRLGDLANDAAADGGVADDALRHVSAARLELRLHQDDRLPVVRGEPEDRRQSNADADERDVA